MDTKSNDSRGWIQIRDFYKHLENKQKYKGQLPITLRSSYEIKFAKFLDLNKNVLEWSSESLVIPYVWSYDKKEHRYFVDFWMKVQENDGSLKEYLIEIKPLSQTQEPKQKHKTKAFVKRLLEYQKNLDKWNAARNFCEYLRKERGKNIEFKLITERELKI